MCELYPRFRSCCGIQLRVGLIFIAVLSIVTGALINAAIKKAGVDVSSIKDVLAAMSTTTTTTEATNTSVSSTLKPKKKQEHSSEEHGRQGVEHSLVVPRSRLGIEAKKRKSKTTTVEIIGEDGRTEAAMSTTTSEKSTPKPKQKEEHGRQGVEDNLVVPRSRLGIEAKKRKSKTTTVEIIDEDGRTEAAMSTTTSEKSTPKPKQKEEQSSEEHGRQGVEDSLVVPRSRLGMPSTTGWSTVEIIGEDGRAEIISFEDSSEDEEEVQEYSLRGNSTQGKDAGIAFLAYAEPTNTTNTTEDWYTGLMSKINRNGLNLLAVAFIAVGILLFVANFTNSPEMALLCVVVLLVVCVASLGLLVCVVVECLHAPDRCLFKKLDGLSAIIVAMFWFVYVFGEFTFGQNSPESALLCVVVLLVVCVASLGLLVCVVVECLHAPDRCLFKKLDGLSAIIVAMFWFVYVFGELTFGQNSPEMALLCVVVLLVVCVASLGLLVCVVVECLHAPDRCLFKKLDGLSAIIVAMFWFVYVFGEFTFGQNSPEMALLCVVVLLVVCVASLGLLVCVVVECLHAPDRCLLKKLDGLSAIIVAMFWFVYVFGEFTFGQNSPELALVVLLLAVCVASLALPKAQNK